MGDVLEFPTSKAQGMAYLENQLRAYLLDKGADEVLIAYATEQLTSIYARIHESEHYSFSVRLPEGLTEGERSALQGEITEGLEGIRRSNHAMMLQLVAELVLAEVKLFQQQRE